MAIVRYQSGLKNLFDELEDMVSSSFDLVGRQIGHNYPNVDIVEENDGYRIMADLPGMVRDDIELSVSQGILTISGEKTSKIEKTEKDKYTHFERSYGKFTRSFNLPPNTDPEHIDAKFSNGVLELWLKKSKTMESKQIEIKVQ